MSQITTHVLDTSVGRPAANVSIILEAQSPADGWSQVACGATDADGRLRDWPAAKSLPAGTYRLIFDTKAYFAARKVPSLYPQIEIVFEVSDAQQHYHIPLLLSPFGYSTYRGS